MSRLEDAVRRDLAAAPDAPPVAQVQRRAARRRARDAALGTAAFVVVAVVVAVGIVVTRPSGHFSVATGSSTSSSVASSTTTSGPHDARPVATEATFPGLAGVIARVHEYGITDGPIDSAEIVATTRDKTYGMFGGRQPIDHRPIYLIRLTGDFTCDECSRPAGASVQRGDEIMFTITQAPGLPNDVFHLGRLDVDLAAFGRVYRIPLLSARIDLPLHTLKAGASMKGFVVVRNDTGRPVNLIGCGDLFQVALANAKYTPTISWLTCAETFTIPVGSESFPITVAASALTCTTPRGGGHCPALPPGRYEARLYQSSRPYATAAPVAIVVTR